MKAAKSNADPGAIMIHVHVHDNETVWKYTGERAI